MRNLDDLRLSLIANASGSVVDLDIATSAVRRAERDEGFIQLMDLLSRAVPSEGVELDSFLTRFAENCISAGIAPDAMADAMLVTGAMLKTMAEGREAAASVLRATAEGIEAHGA